MATPANAEAADTHVPLDAEPPVEGGITQLAILVLPMSGVGLGVGKCLIFFVDCGQRVGICWFETKQFVLLVEVGVADVSAEVEEYDFDFFAFAAWHAVHDLTVDVLHTTSGIERCLRTTNTIDIDDTNNLITPSFHMLTNRLVALHAEVLNTDDLLGNVQGNLRTMLAEGGTKLVDDVVDLAVGHELLRCGHELCHGVILFLKKVCA